ncbi:Urea carboxylase-related ABC transporter, ATPase protein [Alloalcanivorax dieselolei B5]|uniref:Urea carboxylase-related ABC transporter, ATPase protein n=1 Tax=Alcanivorax dieselolei (strain DSM 16502 / CGMCC 1.3690 / MCCC 1A00001 / B-5) TaxID=930169 RepID=K0C7K0_ALCDB|nr:ABC transporter ATP-binding protein [Alloalcanivorax dieselolei]AFT69449.1 Urea carboxylase-related ABC transporter, ATPase protein [Alloalcanivorax dieselolei B5]GGJ92839.1 ABC transporter ATP-binding protein [Alloalcanivorax dieselolei]
MAIIEMNNLWKEYGDQVVLERLNAEVQEGEFVTLVGASGCGKTTFLKMLLGTESPTRGKLLLDGAPIPDQPDETRGIVFQRYSVLPHLSALENVMLSDELHRHKLIGRAFGGKRKALKDAAMAMLESVGLTQAAGKFPHELSGGMQQRLAIAQALMKRPRILLLDEPFGALDPGIRRDMHHLVLDLWREQGLTIFMVTHDLAEGFYLGTRLWVFDKTRLDPQAPGAYGARITYDLPVGDCDKGTLTAIQEQADATARTMA